MGPGEHWAVQREPHRGEPGAASPENIRPGALSALLQDLVRGPEEAWDGGWERALRPGLFIDRYELVREIGRGGFGVVWEARDRELGREVALKAVAPGGRPDVREERLLREAEAAARLSHPNIVTLFDVGRSEQGPYLVLELLRGEALAARLERGPMAPREALRIAVEVAKALAHAHDLGVTHRDLTPGNVFLCRDGQVKVLDLGMAHAFGKRKAEGGTRAYMAPEQAAGAPEDERTDVFALGVVLFRMLCGELPFAIGDGTPPRRAQPPALEVPDLPALGALVDRMLSRDPVNRPRSCGEVLAALTRFQSELAQLPTSGSTVRVRRRPRSRSLAVAAGLAVLCLAVGLLVRELAEWALRPRGAPSVAVLPFADLSPGHDQEYLADGVAEAILNALARVEGVKVIGRTSSFSFKGKGEDLRDIGRRLDVANILEGSVQREGQRIRITAHLVRVADESSLWSETFDREQAGIFRVQDEIATSVVEALRGKLLGAGGGGTAATATSPEAYYQYLLGQRFYRTFNERGQREALAAFERALKLDPSYAPALAAQAPALQNLSGYVSTRAEVRSLQERAMAAAEQALKLSPDLCTALSARGYLRQNSWEWKGALADLERAVRLCPGDPDVWRRYGAVLSSMGKGEESIAAMERAAGLDPLCYPNVELVGAFQLAAGRLEAARAAFARAAQLDPDSMDHVIDMGQLLLLQGRPAEALERFQAPTERDYPRAAALGCFTAMALHSLGREAEAIAALHSIEARPEPWVPRCLGSAYAFMGDRDRAFALFERAVDEHDWEMPDVVSSPFTRGLHDDPRWQRLLRRMNLPVD